MLEIQKKKETGLNAEHTFNHLQFSVSFHSFASLRVQTGRLRYFQHKPAEKLPESR